MGLSYTTRGSVRGSCGHLHRTAVAAQECLSRDARGCHSQGGYSDRSIVEIETHNESGEWFAHVGCADGSFKTFGPCATRAEALDAAL